MVPDLGLRAIQELTAQLPRHPGAWEEVHRRCDLEKGVNPLEEEGCSRRQEWLLQRPGSTERCSESRVKE